MQIINRICLATLFLFTLNLSAQDDGMPADMGDTGDPCGDVEYPVADPGPDGGCADYADCNGNGAFDLGEPCFEGTDDGDGEEDSMPMFEDVDSDGDGNISFDEAVNFFGDDEGNTEEFNSRDTNGDGMVDSEEFYAGEDSGDEDDDHDGPPPFEDVDANGDGSIDREEARAFFGDDPNFDEEYDNVDASGDGAVDHAEYMAADDGDGQYEEYGDHTVENCIAMAEGHDTYWIGEDEFAVWDDPNVDCGYLLNEIGFMPPPGPPPFDEIDADSNGEVDMEEARAWFQEHDPEYDDAEFEEGYNEVDTNNDGVVDPSEHDAAVAEMMDDMDHENGDDDHDGPPPFEDVDANGDGSIDREEARAFFGDDPNFDEEYDNVDASGDGAVDHAEYMAADDGDHGDEGSGEAQDGYYCAICDMDFGSAEEMDQHAADMGHIDTDMDHEGDDEGGDN